eukprot:3546405-Amphidinium_carterae.1
MVTLLHPVSSRVFTTHQGVVSFVVTVAAIHPVCTFTAFNTVKMLRCDTVLVLEQAVPNTAAGADITSVTPTAPGAKKQFKHEWVELAHDALSDTSETPSTGRPKHRCV